MTEKPLFRDVLLNTIWHDFNHSFDDFIEDFNGEDKLNIIKTFREMASICYVDQKHGIYWPKVYSKWDQMLEDYRSKFVKAEKYSLIDYFSNEYLVKHYYKYMSDEEFNDLVYEKQELSKLETKFLWDMMWQSLNNRAHSLLLKMEPPKQKKDKVIATKDNDNITVSETDEKLAERLDKIESQLNEKPKGDADPAPEEDPFLRHLTEISKFIGCGYNKSQNLKKEFQHIFIQNGRKFLVNKWVLLEEMKKKGRKMGRKHQ